MKILILQPIECETPGFIKDLMIKDGFDLTTIELDAGEKIPDDLKKFDESLSWEIKPAILQLKPSVSKWLIFFMPDTQLIKFFQVWSLLLPIEVNKPNPVTTTFFISFLWNYFLLSI